MRKTYRIKYEMFGGSYRIMETSGNDLTESQAINRVKEYLDGNGILYRAIISCEEFKNTEY